MTKSEALSDINGTIEQIREYCRYVDSESEAEYVLEQIYIWTDQLRNDIDVCHDAEEDKEDEKN